MRTFLFSFLSLFLIVATSCDVNIANQQEVKTIDSTLTVLNTTIEALDTIDHSSFSKMTARLESIDTVVWKYFEKGDTAKYWKNELSKLKLCILSLDRYEGESKAIEMALLENKKQLETLKHDLENDLVEKDKIAEYVALEVNTTSGTLSKAAKRGGRALYCVQNYDEIVAKADSILNILETNDWINWIIPYCFFSHLFCHLRKWMKN